jgi:DNA-binding winged helix-turn-helix (wHTH) protein
VKYDFGSVRIDADARTASTAAGVVHLTRKAFDLLLLLLECRPNAVSKDRIYERLWPDTFVSEASLQTLIHEIRQALDTDSSQESWIRTVRGIGYSFAGSVAVYETESQPAPPPAAWLTSKSMRLPLHLGENIIGRDCDAQTDMQHPTISRRHARITIAESVTIEDLGSKNGTWLEEVRLMEPRTLEDGALVALGSVTFTFRLVRHTMSTASADLATHRPV